MGLLREEGANYLPEGTKVILDKWRLLHSLSLVLPDKVEAAAARRTLVSFGPAALSSWLGLRHAHDEKAYAFKLYVDNNKDIIDMNASLGAIEGENAHVISERMEA